MQTPEPTRDDDALHLELERRLEVRSTHEAPDPWRVEQVIKESPSEVTQLVWLRTVGGGELGPYVRKIIAASSGLGEVWQLLWQRQCQGMRSCRLPRVIVCEERAGTLAVVMEHITGPTLRERILQTSPEERLQVASTLMPRLCLGVAELNEGLGEVVIHRDITPSNVVCSGLEQDVPVLIDLGIARRWQEGQEADTTHFGTRAYAPPEQFGFGQTDLRTDVYALGMCAFFCLTGQDPTPEDREAGFAHRGIPEDWHEIIAKACAFDPAERYGSARELGQAVATLASPKTGEAPTRDGTVGAGARTPVRRVLVRLWRGRNLIVLPLVALLVAASTANVLDPTTLNRGGNPWYNAFGYLVYMNYCILALGYALMDKRWLNAHVPGLGGPSQSRTYRVLGGIFAALTTLLLVLSILLQ